MSLKRYHTAPIGHKTLRDEPIATDDFTRRAAASILVGDGARAMPDEDLYKILEVNREAGEGEQWQRTEDEEF